VTLKADVFIPIFYYYLRFITSDVSSRTSPLPQGHALWPWPWPRGLGALALALSLALTVKVLALALALVLANFCHYL